MRPALSITTLGELVIQQDGETVSGFHSRKAEALLIYLAAEQGSQQRRETIFTLLWPGMPEKSARHNLRQVLYALRQQFPDVTALAGADKVPLFQSDRTSIQINPDAAIEVDTHQFNEALNAIRDHDHLSQLNCETCLQTMERMVALYQGPFLGDFYLEDSNEFEDWAAARREAYRTNALETLEILTETFIQKGEYDTARSYADRQLSIDPLREGAYLQLMELLSKSGQRAEALRVYQQCARTMEIELGTHPSRETTALFEIIRGDDPKKSATPIQAGAIRGFEIRDLLGSGHTGAVYKAYQPAIGRDVAIKVILPQFANHPDFIRRFEVEARTIARLEHPHIIPLYDFWRDPSGAYLVMRWMKGGNLQKDLQRGGWKPQPALHLVDQVTDALALAHRQGVVHCDIKPANVLLDEDGNAYLSDFGIAILTGPLAQLSQSLSSGNGGSSSGSLGYASPEAARGFEPTPLADIYSLGVVLYELLTGAHPFPGIEGQALVQMHLSDPLPSALALRPELPEAVDAVIQQATQKDPQRRYPDVESLAKAFRMALISEGAAISEVSVPKTIERNPYKGLRPFSEADAADFFGREALVSRLLARLAPPDDFQEPVRFLAVVGPSGSGKSSAVKAGLIPAIRGGAISGSEEWFVVEMSPGLDPLEELESALLQIATETPDHLDDQLRADPGGLSRLLRDSLPGFKDEILLVVDQFEELFTLVEDENERNLFLEALTSAVSDPNSRLRVVITLRADFYDRPLVHSHFGELVRGSTEVVLPLNPEELTRAIRGPGEGVGAKLEPALVTRIVGDIGDQPGSLPLLQYALTETFEHRQGNRLTLESYSTSGGVLGALGRRADEIYTNLDADERAMTRQLFLRLVTLGEGIEDTRQRVRRSEIESVASRSPAGIRALVDQFGRYRLLTFDHDPATREPTVEVAHEALLREWPRLRGWLDESRDDIRLQRLLGAAAQEWLASGKDPGFLLRGARLDQYALWSEDTDVALTTDERVYLETSLEKRREREAAEAERRAHEAKLEDRSRNFLRALVGVFAIAAVVAVGLSVVAFGQRNLYREEQVIAETQARISFARELAAAAKNNLALNPERSLLLALESVFLTREVDGTVVSEAESALHQAVQASHVQLVLPGNVFEGVPVFNSDGTRIASVSNGKILVSDSISGETQMTIPIGEYSGNMTAVAFSPDGTQLAAVLTDQDQGRLKVWDMDTGEELLTYNSISSEDYPSLAFSPDGNHIAAINVFQDPIIVEVPSGKRISLTIDEWAKSVAFSPDGAKLAAAYGSGLVAIWDIKTQKIQFKLLGHSFGTSATGVQFSQDGNRLVTTGFDRRVIVWNLETGGQELELTLYGMMGGQNLQNAAFSPDGERLATFDTDGQIQVWDLEREIELYRFTCVSAPFGMHFNYDFTRVVSIGTAGIPTICRVGPDVEAFALAGHTPGYEVWDVDFDSSGKRLVTATWDAVNIWDLPLSNPSGSILEQPTRVLDSIHAAVISPDGKRVAANDPSFNGVIWDAETGQKLRTLLSAEVFYSYEFNPDGTRLLTSTESGKVLVFDPDSRKILLDIQAHADIAGKARFSPDGKRILSLNWDAEPIKVWDAESGELLQTFLIEKRKIDAVFSPDGAHIAVGTREGHLLIWDVETGELLSDHPGESSAIFRLAYSIDGKRIFSGSFDGKASVWDAVTGEKLYTMADFTGGIWYVAVSPDGKYLATGNQDGRTQFFLLDLDDLIALAKMRVTRNLTPAECQQYLHMDACP